LQLKQDLKQATAKRILQPFCWLLLLQNTRCTGKSRCAKLHTLLLPGREGLAAWQKLANICIPLPTLCPLAACKALQSTATAGNAQQNAAGSAAVNNTTLAAAYRTGTICRTKQQMQGATIAKRRISSRSFVL
jgi:hypothetical protein